MLTVVIRGYVDFSSRKEMESYNMRWLDSTHEEELMIPCGELSEDNVLLLLKYWWS